MSDAATSLFDPDAPRLFTIPPGANFLREFAQTLAAATDLKEFPEALADALIYVPNRRSATALSFELLRANDHRACLLPDIRVLGDLETDEPPPSAEAAIADLPPVMPNAQRIGELTLLVLAYYKRQDLSIPATSALAAARELARLLDQAALSGEVDWARLNSVISDRDLAQHWQQSLEFLKIITEQWPAKLEDATAMDPYARRFAAAASMAQSWQKKPPPGPVIIAGSTGATPASQVLMAAALAMPDGMVVLPGLDNDIPQPVWDSLSETPSHPQFSIARALKNLNHAPADVAEWPMAGSTSDIHARQKLVHEALAPANFTADWTQRLAEIAPSGNVADFVADALNGMTILETENDHEEAMLAALAMREILETKDQTAAFVTPDAGLARSVSAELARWDVHVPPSSGSALLQTSSGSFAYLTATWLSDPSHPETIAALQQHSAFAASRDDVERLDCHFLRGPRTWQSLAALHGKLDDLARTPKPKYASFTPADIAVSQKIIARLRDVWDKTGLVNASDPVNGSDWLIGLERAIDGLAKASDIWQGEQGAALSQLVQDLHDLFAPLGPQNPETFSELFKAEANQISVSAGTAHPRLAIWGPLEARLQTADRLILAGLNEGVWPAQPAADAFLPRLFRAEIGLSDPDERIGLSAHDFAQLACAPKVTLLTSRRRDDKPAVASRWIWRLRTLARGALGNQDAEQALAPAPETDPRAWLKAIQATPQLEKPIRTEPQPKPAASARPRRLSVTRIETLIRDPYAIYCQHVLGLQKLEPINAASDARLRGIAIHKALELFETPESQQSSEELVRLLERELASGGESAADLIALRDVRRQVAADYINWRAESADQVVGAPETEISGKISIDIAGQNFTLSGTADRIEARSDQRSAILDFKSGKAPSEKQVRSGLSPQMPLLGLIATRGGFEKLGPVDISDLIYVQFGTRFLVTEIGKPARGASKPVSEIIQETEQGLINLLTQFADPNHPYLSAPRPERVQYWSDFTRLARRDEWLGLATYD